MGSNALIHVSLKKRQIFNELFPKLNMFTQVGRPAFLYNYAYFCSEFKQLSAAVFEENCLKKDLTYSHNYY